MAAQRFDNADGRIRGRKLQTRRLNVWCRDPLCATCGQLTDYPQGFQLDHRVPLFAGGQDIEANCQVLCLTCHADKSVLERADMAQASLYPEWMPPAPHVTLVCGPPGSGKTTYIEQHKQPGDLVLDMDYLKAEATGQPLYAEEGLNKAIFLRNERLGRLGLGKGWLIITGRRWEREWWSAKLGTRSLVLLKTPADVCIKRINADTRRPPPVKARQIQVVRDWWLHETGQTSRARKPTFNEEGMVQW